MARLVLHTALRYMHLRFYECGTVAPRTAANLLGENGSVGSTPAWVCLVHCSRRGLWQHTKLLSVMTGPCPMCLLFQGMESIALA